MQRDSRVSEELKGFSVEEASGAQDEVGGGEAGATSPRFYLHVFKSIIRSGKQK